MKKIKINLKLFLLLILVPFFSIIFPQNSSGIGGRISEKYAVKTYWEKAPIMPQAAKYFIRTEKIKVKKTVLNNHPINISKPALRKMLSQLAYKYDRDRPEIPLFSDQELELLTNYVPKALQESKANHDVTFVIKGPHSSARWALREERLTAGRIFVSNNQLNLILGAVQVNLQPTIDERYQGNVWETTKLYYDIGRRKKSAKYEGLVVVYDQEKKGIYRKSSKRKDWFVFTELAYQQAIEKDINTGMSREQYRTLQGQIDVLQKQLNKGNNQRPIQRQKKKTITKDYPKKESKSRSANTEEKQMILQQRLNTLEKLYKKGMLDENEYQRKRQEILNEI